MKIKYKPEGSLLAALDIGSHKNACIIGRVVDQQGSVEVVGAAYQASQGIKNGAVVDLEKAGSSIRQVVHMAESMAAGAMKGYPLRDIIVNVPATHTSSHIISAQVDVSGKRVADKDINKVLSEAQNQLMAQDRELIHTIPVRCKIDGQEGIKDPVDMTGNILELDVHLVDTDMGPLQNLIHCVEQSHLDIEALCSSSYASGLACLVEDEMDLGCTLIDMGAGSTGFAIFQDGKVIHTGSVPIGSWHITNDLAKGLTCSNTDAERLKTLYGSALVAPSDENEVIEVQKLGENDQHATNQITRSLLIGIIQPRLEEILEFIQAQLEKAPLNAPVGRRVVITGGGSQLPGLRDLSQTVLDKQVRLGLPIKLSGLPDAMSGPAFSSVAGLITYAATRSHEIPGDILAQTGSGSLWEKFGRWWKENW
ncbi:MAG: cell division protein FtsA [Alphaproteobacteria bacterium]|nr:cell division protein FtsA [Alphaproteobacteria bacterium]